MLEIIKDKGKAVPLQAWTGPGDSRRLRLPDSTVYNIFCWYSVVK